jgi:hypothetical protein
MPRLSIRSLMALIVVAGVSLAALRNANAIWAGMLLMVALAAVGVAVMGTVILRGKERYWWAGFAFFGGGYLALTFAPSLGDTFRPRLGTSLLLEYVHARVADSSISSFEVSRADPSSVLFRVRTSDGAVHDRTVARSVYESTPGEEIVAAIAPANRWRAALPGAANHDQFLNVGHCLFSLLAGLLGGAVALWFWERREGGDTASIVQGGG